MKPDEIRLPGTNATSAGLYVAFRATPERVEKGAKISTCNRCGELVGHYPKDSIGHEIVCLTCAIEVPQIRQHIDQIAKSRGE